MRSLARERLSMRHAALSLALDQIAQAIGSLRAARRRLMATLGVRPSSDVAWRRLLRIEARLDRVYDQIRRHQPRDEKALEQFESKRKGAR
jgi:hypothetical protein